MTYGLELVPPPLVISTVDIKLITGLTPSIVRTPAEEKRTPKIDTDALKLTFHGDNVQNEPSFIR